MAGDSKDPAPMPKLTRWMHRMSLDGYAERPDHADASSDAPPEAFDFARI